MQGGSLLFAEVVLGMVVVVVLWMLDAGLGVDVALRSETFGTRAGHGCVEVEDAP